MLFTNVRETLVLFFLRKFRLCKYAGYCKQKSKGRSYGRGVPVAIQRVCRLTRLKKYLYSQKKWKYFEFVELKVYRSSDFGKKLENIQGFHETFNNNKIMEKYFIVAQVNNNHSSFIL